MTLPFVISLSLKLKTDNHPLKLRMIYNPIRKVLNPVVCNHRCLLTLNDLQNS